MKLNRDITSKINRWIDQILPPFLRDSYWFMYPFVWLIFKEKTKYFLTFKDRAPYLSEQEFTEYYVNLADKHIKRPTDLSEACVVKIVDEVVGPKVLDIACGRGFLVEKLAADNSLEVTGVDIIIPDFLKNTTNVKYLPGNVEDIPFPDKHFDTVICTHTLEHVLHLDTALQELRRVTKHKLIIVIPCQRPYKYTFDLHLRFFPYPLDVFLNFKNQHGKLEKIENDWFYMEEFQ
jgi:SAM-dependent methyltransferase